MDVASMATNDKGMLAVPTQLPRHQGSHMPEHIPAPQLCGKQNSITAPETPVASLKQSLHTYKFLLLFGTILVHKDHGSFEHWRRQLETKAMESQNYRIPGWFGLEVTSGDNPD